MKEEIINELNKLNINYLYEYIKKEREKIITIILLNLNIEKSKEIINKFEENKKEKILKIIEETNEINKKYEYIILKQVLKDIKINIENMKDVKEETVKLLKKIKGK
jgi:flagellar motor switch protein FliG